MYGIQPGLDYARTRMEDSDVTLESLKRVIRYFNPAYFIIENPEGRMKDRPVTSPLLPFCRRSSYCRYVIPYRKNTHIWTNIPLAKPLDRCRKGSYCPSKLEHGKHLQTAQSGSSRDGTLGSGGAKQVYPVPHPLVLDLFRPAVDALTSRSRTGFADCFSYRDPGS